MCEMRNMKISEVILWHKGNKKGDKQNVHHSLMMLENIINPLSVLKKNCRSAGPEIYLASCDKHTVDYTNPLSKQAMINFDSI